MSKKIVGLFCFDGPLYKDKNGVYCNVTLTNEMFSRFFKVVDELVIAIRTYNIDKTYEEANMKPLQLENIRVVEVPNFNSVRGILLKRKEFEKKILSVVVSSDLIFCRMPSTTCDLIIPIVRRLNKPYLVEVGGCAWDAFWNHGLLGKIVAPIMYKNEKKNVYYASYATYVTKEFLQKRYPNKGIIDNCSNVYIKDVPYMVLEKRLQKIKNMDMKKIVFGQAVNSIDVKYKGEDVVLQLMHELKKYGINSEFQIVGPGDGKYIKKVAKKLSLDENVKLIGTLRKDEMLDWYQSIDVYMQPSKQEGLPRSVIEAMSQGVPCLGSNVAGIPELLEEAYLLELRNMKQMIKTTKRCLDKEILAKMAQHNFDTAKQYRIEIIEDRREKIFLAYKEYACKNRVTEV